MDTSVGIQAKPSEICQEKRLRKRFDCLIALGKPETGESERGESCHMRPAQRVLGSDDRGATKCPADPHRVPNQPMLNSMTVFGSSGQNMATISDVAQRAGVSLSTVSHVVNGTRHVSADTKAIVERAIKDLGFMPNAVARSLARAATNAVGIAISTSTNSYFMDVVCAIETACSEQGQMVFLADTKDDPEIELEVVRALHQRRVDGIILAPSADPERKAIRYIQEHNIPCVLVDRLIDEDLDQVGVTNGPSMKQLVKHLIALGHKRIALIAGQPNFTTTLERIEGYYAALNEHGIGIDPALVHPGNATVAAAAEAATKLFRSSKPPTAIAAGNNLAMIGVMQAVRSAGLRVPSDIALAGFDDFEWADCFEPRLTVMAQPCAEIGRNAAVLLSQRIKDEHRPRVSVRLDPKLVVRASCGSDG
jgi:LacI family transcriptional regulator